MLGSKLAGTLPARPFVRLDAKPYEAWVAGVSDTFIPAFSNSSTYRDGITKRVSTVETNKPKIMPLVMGAHSAPPIPPNARIPSIAMNPMAQPVIKCHQR